MKIPSNIKTEKQMGRRAPTFQSRPNRKVKVEVGVDELRDALAALVAAAEGNSGHEARMALGRAKALLEECEQLAAR